MASSKKKNQAGVMLKREVLLQLHSISFFSLCIIILHNSKWIEDTKQTADHNRVSGAALLLGFVLL